MTECLDGAWRDQLPDRVTGQLSAAEALRIDTHVAGCGRCAEELRLLQRVHAVRSTVRVPSVAAITARLPRPVTVLPVSVPSGAGPVRTIGATVRPISSAPSRRGLAGRLSLPGWKLAASALVVLGVGSVSWLAGPSRSGVPRSGAVAMGEPRTAVPADWGPDVSLSYGGVGDLSETEMQEIVALLEEWDGTPSTEIATTSLVVAGGGDRE